jgi:hypothetical protein
MEACNNEIRISFSLPELDLIRKAVERFGHREAEERPSATHSDHTQQVNRVLDKIVPVHSVFQGEASLLKMRHRAETGESLMGTAPLNGFLFSSEELAKIL